MLKEFFQHVTGCEGRARSVSFSQCFQRWTHHLGFVWAKRYERIWNGFPVGALSDLKVPAPSDPTSSCLDFGMSNDNEMFWDVLRCFVLLHLGLWAAGIGAGVSFAIHSGEVQALRCIACLATMVKVLDFSQSYSGHEFSVNFLFSPGNQSCYVVSACFKFVPSFLQLLIYAIIIPWVIHTLSTRKFLFLRMLVWGYSSSVSCLAKQKGVSVHWPQVFGLLGHNGAGKTQLGLYHCTANPHTNLANINGTLACL